MTAMVGGGWGARIRGAPPGCLSRSVPQNPSTSVETSREHTREGVRWRTPAAPGQLGVPPANVDSQAAYQRKLEASGFGPVAVTSLRADVFPPLHHWLAQPGRLRRFHPLARLPWYALRRLDAHIVYGAVDYVLVSADKPA
jgi:hypothetical protein